MLIDMMTQPKKGEIYINYYPRSKFKNKNCMRLYK